MSELLTYGAQLRSITQGRGSFHLEFSHYAEVPHALQDKIVARRRTRAGSEGSLRRGARTLTATAPGLQGSREARSAEGVAAAAGGASPRGSAPGGTRSSRQGACRATSWTPSGRPGSSGSESRARSAARRRIPARCSARSDDRLRRRVHRLVRDDRRRQQRQRRLHGGKRRRGRSSRIPCGPPRASPSPPEGAAVRTEGGLRVNGRWRFASGITHSDWVWAGWRGHGGRPGRE